MKKSLICIIFTLFLLSCDNPMYKDVVTQKELDLILQEKFKGLITVTVPAAKAVYIEFIDGGEKFKLHDDPTSKNWHLSSADATWRFSSNSGTTASAVGSGGTGGVKVFNRVAFDDIKSINHTEGLINTEWETDKMLDYGDRNLSLNYYLTKGINNTTDRPAFSETYLFNFEASNMMAGDTAYLAGTDYTYLISDGNGGNYVKLQAIGISTDGSGMTFNNRIYKFNYEVADKDGNFKGSGS